VRVDSLNNQCLFISGKFRPSNISLPIVETLLFLLSCAKIQTYLESQKEKEGKMLLGVKKQGALSALSAP